jgi:hypothetical protein
MPNYPLVKKVGGLWVEEGGAEGLKTEILGFGKTICLSAFVR